MRRVSMAVVPLILAVVAIVATLTNAAGLGSQDASPAPDDGSDRLTQAGVPSECIAQSLGTPVGLVRSPETDPQAAPSVVLFDLGYDPCALTIPADTPVTVSLSNEGEAVGNLVIDVLGVRSGDINPGQVVTVTINAPAGVYAFYSDIPGHLEAGQAGVLRVIGAGTPVAGTPTVATPVP